MMAASRTRSLVFYRTAADGGEHAYCTECRLSISRNDHSQCIDWERLLDSSPYHQSKYGHPLVTDPPLRMVRGRNSYVTDAVMAFIGYESPPRLLAVRDLRDTHPQWFRVWWPVYVDDAKIVSLAQEFYGEHWTKQQYDALRQRLRRARIFIAEHEAVYLRRGEGWASWS